ncbi:MAG: nuclear transport factor 2 family protein [Gammaproteobacteria bacterium]|nr:nuclear transport factor 2 family protein [Gammaproteobacteria bacterium]MDH4253705.1 nuclear transport factor 2 family protein [Gammaproteobacteria bacterium]MDH5309983.1 nuclear transport factor 2 family protein [Gammaproteobacteria bacterium]
MSQTDTERGRRSMASCSRLVLGACILAAATPVVGEDEAGPLQAVNRFFDAMAGNDAALAATVMIEDGYLYGYVDGPEGLRLVPTSIADYLAGMGRRRDSLLERIWDAQVLRDGRLAVVWTPYDFYRNGEFHHCGVNSFNLILVDDGWKIASVVYSMLTENCKPSPLGAPEFDAGVTKEPQ